MAKMTLEERKAKKYDEILERESQESKKRLEILSNPERNKLASELSHRLVQCCIDFINETGNTDIWRVNFFADCLQESAKYGKWCPCTDASCEIENEKETISYSI